MNMAEPKKKEFSVDLKFAKKKDVVVVGSGPAGVIAAFSARRNGADVLLLEREAETSHAGSYPKRPSGGLLLG